MIYCYLNQPNKAKNVHLPDGCNHLHKHGGGRELQINAGNLSQTINDFTQQRIDFSASGGTNDLRLQIDLGNIDYEKATFKYLTQLLGHRYRAFQGEIHFCSHCFSRKTPTPAQLKA